ncbi:hypothetical protein DOY81_015105, partial [Sarcophaga bullata]
PHWPVGRAAKEIESGEKIDVHTWPELYRSAKIRSWRIRIRDLNDEINKLLREKTSLGKSISALGGHTIAVMVPKCSMLKAGKCPAIEVYNTLELPKFAWVRELILWGYRDDDDGILIPIEERIEQLAVQTAVREWKEKMARDGHVDLDDEEEEDIYPLSIPAREAAEDAKNNQKEDNPMELLAPKFTAHVPVPTQKDIEEALLRKRKQELLDKYVGSA